MDEIELDVPITFRCSIFEDRFPQSPNAKAYGGVAQLGEHLPCKQGVMGSNPIISTKMEKEPNPTEKNNGL